MKFQKYQTFFLTTLCLIALADGVFDVLTLRQSSLTTKSSKSIFYTNDIIGTLSRTNSSLRENFQARLKNDKNREQLSLLSLNEQYKELQELTKEDPLKKDLLHPFEFTENTTKNIAIDTHIDNLATATSEGLKGEFSLIREQIKNYNDLFETLNFEIVWASFLDLALILLTAVTWFYYHRFKRKTEIALSKKITAAQESNTELRGILAKKTIDLRTTVHDLKNPLSSMKGLSDLLVDECGNPNSVKEMSTLMKEISERTLEMINTLVERENQRAKNGSTLRPINITALLDDIIFTLLPQTKLKHQTLKAVHSNQTLQVFGDPNKIWDLFMNLIGNAVKFSPLKGIIQIRSEAVDGQVRVEIEDEGPGFSDSDKLKAFEMFQRLSAQPTGGESSSGLGLYIAKETVKYHNGTIKIQDSSSGKGACIVVELPLMIRQENHANNQKDSPETQNNL